MRRPAQIGVGGMREVYRARDTKLDRDVVIKVLPSHVAADPERLAQFQREVEVLASRDRHFRAVLALQPAVQTGKPLLDEPAWPCTLSRTLRSVRAGTIRVAQRPRPDR